MPIKLREMVPEDIDEVLAIQLENGLSHWSGESYLEEIERSESIALCVQDLEKVSGFIVARLIMSEKEIADVPSPRKRFEAELLNLGISKSKHRQGFGGSLLTACFELLSQLAVQTIWLEVRESNLQAIEFYKKNGFLTAYFRKSYYTCPVENAVVMKKSL